MNKTDSKSSAKETSYKGNPVLALYQADHNTPLVKFGVQKADLILAHMPEIKAFMAKHQGRP